MKSISVAFLALAIASARAAPALVNLEGLASPGANGAATSSDDVLSGAAALSPGANSKRAIPIVGDLLVGTGIVTAAVANPMVPEPISAVASPGNLVGGVVNTLNGGTIAQRSLIDLSNAAAPGSNTNPVAGIIAPQLGLEGTPFGELSQDLLEGHGILSPGQNTGITTGSAAVRPKKRDLIDLSGVLAPGSNTNGLEQLGDSLLNGVGALSPGQNTLSGVGAGQAIPITGGNPIAQPVVVAAKRGLVDLGGVLSPGIDNPKGTLAQLGDSLFDGTNALSPGANTDVPAAVVAKRGLIDLSGVLSPGGQNLETLGDALLEGQNALSPGANTDVPAAVVAKRGLVDLSGVLSPGGQSLETLGDALLEGQNALSPGASAAPVAVPVALPKRQILDLSNAASPGSNTDPLTGTVEALLDGSGIFSPGQNTVVPAAKRQILDLSGAAAPGSNTNPLTGTLQQVGDALLNGAGILSPGQNTLDASQPSVVVPATMIQKRDLPIPVVGALTGAQAPAELLATVDGLLPIDALLNNEATVDNLAPGIASIPASAAAAAPNKRQIQGIVDVTTAPLIGETGSLTAATRVPLQAPVDAVLQAVPVPGVHRKRSQGSKRFDGSLIDIHGAGSPGVDVSAGDASTALLNAQNVLSPGGGANTKGPLDVLDDIPGINQIVNVKGSLAAGNGASNAVPVAVPVPVAATA